MTVGVKQAAGKTATAKKKVSHDVSSKRGRPTRTRVAAIDEGIIATALTLFLENGYAATSMEAVATAAAISKGTLYARYSTKPDLFRAIVADRLAAWSKAEQRLTDGPGNDPARYLMHYGETFLTSMRNPEVWAFDRLVVAEAARFPELAEEFHQQGFVQGIDEFAAMLEQCCSQSRWPAFDAKSVAITFTSALLGWFHNEKLRRDPSNDDCLAFLTRLVAVITSGRAAW